MAKAEGHYHLNKQVFTRSKGHTATGGAAYRAGERIYDERTGETFDYRRKQGIYGAEIQTPEKSPAWANSRDSLWNKVEQTERRKDSQIAYSLTLALPNDIPHEEKTKTVRQYVQDKFVSKGMIADIAYHDFEGKYAHNPHAHVMFTTRRLDGDRFSAKKEEEWRPKIAKVGGKVIVDPEQLKQEREEWAGYINATYKRLGMDKRVDHRSFKERGIDRIPQIHMGAAHSIEHPKDNRDRQPKTTRLGDMNRLIAEMNQKKDLEYQLAQVLEEKKHYQQQIKRQKRRVANDGSPPIDNFSQTNKASTGKSPNTKDTQQARVKAAEELNKQKQQQKLEKLNKPRNRDR